MEKEKPCQECKNKFECLERFRQRIDVLCKTIKHEQFEKEGEIERIHS